jgi:hypothetical protein
MVDFQVRISGIIATFQLRADSNCRIYGTVYLRSVSICRIYDSI